MSENRRAPRRRCLIGAHVKLERQASTINCVVRSLSESGAKIEFEAIQLLPNRFTLRLDSGVEYTVTSVAWQIEKQMGIVFSQVSDANDERAFAHNRLKNAAAFQEEISRLPPSATAIDDACPNWHRRPPEGDATAAATRSDLGLEFRKRIAQLTRK
jgi:PilZ domain